MERMFEEVCKDINYAIMENHNVSFYKNLYNLKKGRKNYSYLTEKEKREVREYININSYGSVTLNSLGQRIFDKIKEYNIESLKGIISSSVKDKGIKILSDLIYIQSSEKQKFILTLINIKDKLNENNKTKISEIDFDVLKIKINPGETTRISSEEFIITFENFQEYLKIDNEKGEIEVLPPGIELIEKYNEFLNNSYLKTISDNINESLDYLVDLEHEISLESSFIYNSKLENISYIILKAYEKQNLPQKEGLLKNILSARLDKKYAILTRDYSAKTGFIDELEKSLELIKISDQKISENYTKLTQDIMSVVSNVIDKKIVKTEKVVSKGLFRNETIVKNVVVSPLIANRYTEKVKFGDKDFVSKAPDITKVFCDCGETKIKDYIKIILKDVSIDDRYRLKANLINKFGISSKNYFDDHLSKKCDNISDDVIIVW